MGLNFALAGNPNCGKTTLFNALTGSNQFVGNWPGVTVEKKEGRLKGHKDVTVVDLPGVYSLSPYSPEERVTRDFIVHGNPDAVIVILDGSNIERNLYFASQILDLKVPVVLAMNMMDVVNKRGDKIDCAALSKLLGCPVCPISAIKGDGVDELIKAAIATANSKAIPQPSLTFTPPADLPEDPEEAEGEVISARYDYVAELVARCVQKKPARMTPSDRIDSIVTNRILALPIFAVIMFLVYAIAMGGWSISIGTAATDWANDVLFGEWVPGLFDSILGGLGVAEDGWLYGLIQDGIVAGVGAVLGFVPQMLVLFFLLCILEDCGYMARVAFIMDRIFRRFGLSGKSFIPMLVATGCGVPGIMASRTIEQERDRRMTIMTTGFIPCGAKMPIIGLFAGALFGGSAWVATSAFFIGIAAVVISGIMLKKFKAFAGDPAPFVMELPAYHLPTPGNILRGTWERGWSFIKRAGTVILLSSIILWFLQGYGFVDGVFQAVEDNNDSLLAVIGNGIAWIFYPLGWAGDWAWKAAVATITGLIAKEEVVGTLGVLYQYAGELSEEGEEIWGLIAADFTALTAYSFMIFNLLCAPCFAAMGAIKREMNSPKWTLAAIGYMCAFAYVISMIVYQIGGLITGQVAFSVFTIVAVLLLAGILYLLFRKGAEPAERHRLDMAAARA